MDLMHEKNKKKMIGCWLLDVTGMFSFLTHQSKCC